MNTEDEDYARRLSQLQLARWKRILRVQAPYRWMLRRLRPGYFLDVGCGIGRSLEWFGDAGIGVDHNESAVRACRARGLTAFSPEELWSSSFVQRGGTFDSLLFSHVLEHMSETDAVALIELYSKLLKDEGKVIVITPQEAGFASDPTHVNFTDFDVIERVLSRAGFRLNARRSFPFPRFAGRMFKYNEFVVVARQTG